MSNKELDGMMKKLMKKSEKEVTERRKKLTNDEVIIKVAALKMSVAEFQKHEQEQKISGQLTDAQVENWRKVLCGMIGPYALIMPKYLIQAFRDKMQREVNLLDEELNKGG
jgi:hypothetical protein